MSYNGWANYETWNVCLWIDNEESLYHEKMRVARRLIGSSSRDATLVESFVREVFPQGTPDMVSIREHEKKPSDLSMVDWEEIADAWQKEAEE